MFTFYFFQTAENRVSNGGAPMQDRLLCAIDEFESGQSALDFVAGAASVNDTSVRVLHLREVPRMTRALPLETPDEAENWYAAQC